MEKCNYSVIIISSMDLVITSGFYDLNGDNGNLTEVVNFSTGRHTVSKLVYDNCTERIYVKDLGQNTIYSINTTNLNNFFYNSGSYTTQMSVYGMASYCNDVFIGGTENYGSGDINMISFANPIKPQLIESVKSIGADIQDLEYYKGYLYSGGGAR